jgi:peptide/nickel transport system permease protein/oligopeptide transport system permease protein
MRKYLLRRLLALLPGLLLASVVTFLMVRLIPGDPIDLLIGPDTPESRRQSLVESYGLDRSLPVQYLLWMKAILHGDLGESIAAQRPVIDVLGEQLPDTAALGLAALVLSMMLGIGLGVASGMARGRPLDYLASGVATVAMTIPGFWLGLLLILVFAVQLGWLPVSGADTAASMILPAIALGLAGAGLVARVLRGSLIEAMSRDYVLLLKARGISQSRIFWRHALRNALIPVVTILGLRIGWVIGGAVPVEVVFARPGVGSLLVESIGRRDYPVVQATLLMLALAVMLGSLIADLVQAWIDPRVRRNPG